MPRENYGGPDTLIDPFYPDGYVSTDQDRAQIIAQKEKYAARVNSINLKFPLKSYRRGFFQGNTDTISAVRENIKILLLTLKGERVMHANLGTNIPVLQGQLFEPITRDMLNKKGGFSSDPPFLFSKYKKLPCDILFINGKLPCHILFIYDSINL